jgi:hypothetical protein
MLVGSAVCVALSFPLRIVTLALVLKSGTPKLFFNALNPPSLLPSKYPLLNPHLTYSALRILPHTIRRPAHSVIHHRTNHSRIGHAYYLDYVSFAIRYDSRMCDSGSPCAVSGCGNVRAQGLATWSVRRGGCEVGSRGLIPGLGRNRADRLNLGSEFGDQGL